MEEYFVYLRKDGVVVPLHERHAFTMGNQFKEFLGVLQLNSKDRNALDIFNKPVEELRALNWEKRQPRDGRKHQIS